MPVGERFRGITWTVHPQPIRAKSKYARLRIPSIVPCSAQSLGFAAAHINCSNFDGALKITANPEPLSKILLELQLFL